MLLSVDILHLSFLHVFKSWKQSTEWLIFLKYVFKNIFLANPLEYRESTSQIIGLITAVEDGNNVTFQRQVCCVQWLKGASPLEQMAGMLTNPWFQVCISIFQLNTLSAQMSASLLWVILWNVGAQGSSPKILMWLLPLLLVIKCPYSLTQEFLLLYKHSKKYGSAN